MHVYEEEPNIVKVLMMDKSGKAERFISGKSLDEVIATVQAAFGEVAPIKKERKKRRTKAEIADACTEPAPEVAPEEPHKGKKGWA